MIQEHYEFAKKVAQEGAGLVGGSFAVMPEGVSRCGLILILRWDRLSRDRGMRIVSGRGRSTKDRLEKGLECACRDSMDNGHEN